MIVDINRIRHYTTVEIKRWISRHGTNDLKKLVTSTVASCGSPVVETAYLVRELAGTTPEFDTFIDNVTKWYGIKEVRGQLDKTDS
jgi:hypothetical protein